MRLAMLPPRHAASQTARHPVGNAVCDVKPRRPSSLAKALCTELRTRTRRTKVAVGLAARMTLSLPSCLFPPPPARFLRLSMRKRKTLAESRSASDGRGSFAFLDAIESSSVCLGPLPLHCSLDGACPATSRDGIASSDSLGRVRAHLARMMSRGNLVERLERIAASVIVYTQDKMG